MARILAGQDAAPARPEPKYGDPGLQAIWEITELTEFERRLAISAVQGWRTTQRQEARDPVAEHPHSA